MPTAHFIFHGALNDFLPPARRGAPFSLRFDAHQTVKHLVEALGVPHLEVRAVQIAGTAAAFDDRVPDGSLVQVYSLEAESLPPEELRFVLDNHLGRLAASLRMLGFDTLYRNDYQDDELAATAAAQQRILLTRDRRLLMRKAIPRGYCVRQTDPPQQLGAIVQRYVLAPHIRPFQRCMRCNGLLQPVDKADVLDRLEPLTRLYFNEFRQCPACRQVYWKGSHYAHMLGTITALEQGRTRPPVLK